MTSMDLNSDLGEAYGPWSMGEDERMLSIVTSANIACGGHAGDPETMFETLSQAARNGVTIGAHPGYEDRLGFGRRIIPMSPGEISRMVAAQIGSLIGVAALAGTRVSYVKAHGALANLAADDVQVAKAILEAVEAQAENLAILAISGTVLEQVCRAANHRVYSEIFADRAYLSTGRLVPRSHPKAMLHDSGEATDRMVQFLETGKMPVLDGEPIALDAHSICVHGDGPGAVTLASDLRNGLMKKGIVIAPFCGVAQ